MNRETIYAGLFEKFSTLTTGGSPLFKTATRKPKVWEQVAPEDQPALLMRQVAEDGEHRKGLSTKWVFKVELLVYVNSNGATDPDVIPSQLLNPLLDAIEASFVIDDRLNNACTLGGLVAYAAIDGTVQLFSALGDEAVAIVPVRVLVNK